ncbi:hypothetical protein N657DRAFT_630772 [Parathielavia appendiculata]|uniref:Uncharacterized protein n=1 Tax=Parathielavia appendiculata TaxID=2587402 RepID=A0AAN6U6C4_9PEZI|nr:hypothetical protein N657DRAFT_630772 [Parathielavia appendiculata]
MCHALPALLPPANSLNATLTRREQIGILYELMSSSDDIKILRKERELERVMGNVKTYVGGQVADMIRGYWRMGEELAAAEGILERVDALWDFTRGCVVLLMVTGIAVERGPCCTNYESDRTAHLTCIKPVSNVITHVLTRVKLAGSWCKCLLEKLSCFDSLGLIKTPAV